VKLRHRRVPVSERVAVGRASHNRAQELENETLDVPGRPDDHVCDMSPGAQVGKKHCPRVVAVSQHTDPQVEPGRAEADVRCSPSRSRRGRPTWTVLPAAFPIDDPPEAVNAAPGRVKVNN